MSDPPSAGEALISMSARYTRGQALSAAPAQLGAFITLAVPPNGVFSEKTVDSTVPIGASMGSVRSGSA